MTQQFPLEKYKQLCSTIVNVNVTINYNDPISTFAFMLPQGLVGLTNDH